MRNIIGIGALALAIGLSTSASADYRGYHNHGGGGNWAGPMVGGLIIGGLLGSMANQQRYYDAAPMVGSPYESQYNYRYTYQPQCWREFTGYYNQFGRPVYRTLCE